MRLFVAAAIVIALTPPVSVAQRVISFDGVPIAYSRQFFFLPTSRPSLIDSVARMMSSVPAVVAIPASRAFSVYRAQYLRTALQEVGTRIPIVAINAERSQIDSTIAQSVAPKFHVSYMPGVGHFIMMEDPQGFNGQLRRAIALIARR